jgi:bacterioferritin-associated ferredoxin
MSVDSGAPPMDKKALILLKYRPVCICKAIRYGRVQSAIENGAKNVEDVARETGCTSGDCHGERCIPVIRQMLDSHRVR